MAIPLAGGMMAELCGLYREAWQAAGHPGKGRVMLAFHIAIRTVRRPTASPASRSTAISDR
jgi:hypothetical protein